MRRFRFSIAGLIGVVCLAAIGLAAIRASSAPWAGALTSITYFSLIASFLGIVFRRGSRRVFWIGFALLGWSYIALNYSTWGALVVRHYLLAPNLADVLFEVIHPDEASERGSVSGIGGFMGMGGMGGGMGGGMRNMAIGGVAAGPPSPTTASPLAITQIVICLEALLWAYLGGWAARYFASRRGDDTPSPA